MNKTEVFDALYTGNLVEVTKEEYHEWARSAIQKQAGDWIDQGDGIRAQISLMQVQRLDQLYGFSGLGGKEKEDEL